MYRVKSIFAFGVQIGQSASQYYHTTIIILQAFFFFNKIDIDSLLIARGTALGKGHSYTDRVQHKTQTKQVSQLVQALFSQCTVHPNLVNKQQVSVTVD